MACLPKRVASRTNLRTFAAKLVHTGRALFSAITNSHQEPVSGQACDPPDPFSLNILIAYSLHSLVIPIAYFSLFIGEGVLRYPAGKWLLSLDCCRE